MTKHIFKIFTIILFGVALLSGCSQINSSAQTSTAVVENLPVAVPTPTNIKKGEQIAVFAGGCFWGVEAVFEHIKGVSSVKSGYSGGTAQTADYEKVSSGTTGHAEAVEIVFDPKVVSYEQLLNVFFSVAHNPTELNRQGPDTGTQYRSAVFFVNDEQKNATQKYVDKLGKAGTFDKPIVTQIVPLEVFYPAEDYHQDYMANHPNQPYIVIHDKPKVENLSKRFPDLYVSK